MKKFNLLIFFFALVSLPASLRASLKGNHWEFAFGLGNSLPGTNSNELQKAAPAVSVSAEYQWSRKLSAGLEFGQDLGHKLEGTLFTDIDRDGYVDDMKVTSDKEINIFRVGPFLRVGSVSDWGTWGTRWVRNFVILGAAMYHARVSPGHYVVSGYSSNGTDYNGTLYPIKGESGTHFGLNFGIGMEIEIWTHGLVGFDIRYHRYFQSAPDAEYWIPSFRFGFTY